jgi:antitoxin (DNA-binding transcriptional repressor) of toxin-antitoxin stability system
MLDAMKTLTTREFFHAPGLVKSLRPGQSLVVTDNGAPAFTVTKAGRRPVKTAAELRREARELFPGDRPKVDFTSVIKKLKR